MVIQWRQQQCQNASNARKEIAIDEEERDSRLENGWVDLNVITHFTSNKFCYMNFVVLSSFTRSFSPVGKFEKKME